MVTLTTRPRVVVGKLSPEDLKIVRKWIVLNRRVILDHWNEDADSLDLVQRLRRLRDRASRHTGARITIPAKMPPS